MRLIPQLWTAAAAAVLALATVGCGALAEPKRPGLFGDKAKKAESESFLDRMPWAGKRNKDTEPYPNPVKLAATWTPDTLVQTGRTPTRGFGGRVFFYDEKSRPVPVEGTLVIHGFDDAAETPETRIKRFEFTPEQFTRHFSQTDLGASYSIWIPWDAIGGQQRRVSLVASFQPAAGGVVQGIPATLVLPGPNDETAEQRIATMLSPQYQQHVEATESGSTRTSGLTTTTIRRIGSRTNSQPAAPGLNIPASQQAETKVADGKTPVFDLDRRRSPANSTVMPASANLPLK